MASDGTAVTSELLTNRGILHGFFGDGLRVDEIARTLHVAPAHLHQCTQVHGIDVFEARDARDEAIAISAHRADALFTREREVAVAVRTADCVPVLLANSSTGAVAAVHAGWRGLVLGVVEAGWQAMGGADFVAIGPHIRSCCFEVSEEVAEQIAASIPTAAVVVSRHAPEKAMVDLGAAVLGKLQALGADAKQVDLLPRCTRCEAKFPSYRRDGANAGRMVSAIASRA